MSFSDSFTRADSATVGNGWTESNPSIAEILSNNLRLTGNGSDGFNLNYVIAPSSADFQDGTAVCEFTFSGMPVPQLGIRMNSGNGYLAYAIASNIRLSRVSGATLTTLDTNGISLVAGTRYRFTFTISGNTKTLEIYNVDTSSVVDTLTDSADTTYTATGSVLVGMDKNNTIDYHLVTSTGSSADTTAPTYDTSPAISSATNIQIVAGATASDETSSTVNHYAVVVADGATAPSAAQVKAGNDSTGSAAISSGSDLAVTSGAAGSITLTGLTGNTAYDVYYAVEDDVGNITSATLLNQTTQSASVTFTTTGFSGLTGLNGYILTGTDLSSPTILKPFSAIDMVGATIPADLNDVSVTNGQAVKGQFENSDGSEAIPVSGTVSIA